jgi:hypothetical protein
MQNSVKEDPKKAQHLQINENWRKQQISLGLPVLLNLRQSILSNFELLDSCHQGFVWMMYIQIKAQSGQQ